MKTIYKRRMTRMVATLIVGWVVVVATGLGTGILDKLDVIPSFGVLMLISGILLAGSITLLVGMIGTFIIYVEHKLNERNKNDTS